MLTAFATAQALPTAAVEWSPRRGDDSRPATPRKAVPSLAAPSGPPQRAVTPGWNTPTRLSNTSTHLHWGTGPQARNKTQRPTAGAGMPVTRRAWGPHVAETPTRILKSRADGGAAAELRPVADASIPRLSTPTTAASAPGNLLSMSQLQASGLQPTARTPRHTAPRHNPLKSVLKKSIATDSAATPSLHQPLSETKSVQLTQHAQPLSIPAPDFGDDGSANEPGAPAGNRPSSQSGIEAPLPEELFSSDLFDNDQSDAQDSESNPAERFDLAPPGQAPSQAAEEIPQPAESAAGQDLFKTLTEDLFQSNEQPSAPDEQEPATSEPPADASRNPLFLFDGDDANNGTSEDVIEELRATNGRDCTAQAEACETDFAYLRRRQQTNMSLDITPSIEPSEVDMAATDKARTEKLAEVPTKLWTNRKGQVVAEGTLDDYRDDKVWVRTINGSLQAIPHHSLSNQDRCFVAAWWELPEECNFEGEPLVMRDFRLTTFTWAAAASCHKPLYFEEVAVERYGHTSGPIVQPVVSGAHFFGNIIMFPYHAGLHPPNECLYPLGYYRPGDCAPWLLPGFPFTTRGFRWEGLAVGAAIALLP